MQAEKQALLAEQLRLTADVKSLQEQLQDAESLNQSHKATVSEQQRCIDKLLAECKQVGIHLEWLWTVIFGLVNYVLSDQHC